jgi:hypothetical protein
MAELLVWGLAGLAAGAVGLLLAAFVVGFVGYFLAIAFAFGVNAAAELSGFKR